MAGNKYGAWKGLALLSQLGITMTVCILAAIFLGRFLDNFFNTNGIMVLVAVVLGVIVGFMNVYKVVMRGMKK